MPEEEFGYFKDDGTPFNPDLIPKSSLCATCRKNDNPKEETLCNLNRSDQREEIFICFAYDGISGKIQSEAVLKEMERYLERKYGQLDKREGEKHTRED